MTLKLRNTWAYQGGDRWKWTAFIDDYGSGELEEVKFVDYYLHESFPNPVRRVDTRDNGFELSTGGWGTFELEAFAHMKNGKKIRMRHGLKLEYEPRQGKSRGN